MKVFEVRSEEHQDGENGEIVTVEIIQCVTHESDSLLAVTEYFTRECKELSRDLKLVREVLTVCQQLKNE